MTAHKFEIVVLSGDNPEDIKDELENSRNYCFHVCEIMTVDLGEYDDNHPLNLNTTTNAERLSYFKPCWK